jgi:hypothetical protein
MNFMFRNARLLCLALLPLICTQALGLCGRPQPRLVRAEFSQSDAVVIATLVRIRHVEPKDIQDYHLYTFEVENTLRGKIPNQFVIWDENSSARLTFDLLRGRKYLLFVNRWHSPEKGKDWWTADGCGHSGEVSKRKKTLQQIEHISSLQGGLITGEVTSGQDAIANAKIIAISKSNGKHFETRSSVQGAFTLNVPPGEYSVQVKSSGKAFSADDFSYEDPKSIKLEDGGCAQIEFGTAALSRPK